MFNHVSWFWEASGSRVFGTHSSKTISPPSEEFSFALFSGRTPLGFVDILFYLHRTFGLACSQGEILVTIVDSVCICHLTWSSSIWQLATCFEKICFTPFTLLLECVRSNIWSFEIRGLLFLEIKGYYCPSKLRSYNQLQKYLRHCTVFWHKWPVHDLVLVIPPPPLIKVASNTRPYSKLGGTTLNGRKEGGQYYIFQTCDQERFEARKVVFPWECLSIFETGCLSPSYLYSCGARLKRGAPLAPKEVVIIYRFSHS